MKKRMLLAVMVLALAASIFVGCDFSDVQAIEFIQMPKTTYAVDPDFDPSDTALVKSTLSFTLKVTMKKGEPQTLDFATAEGITVTGFDLSKEGSYVATITYDKQTTTFNYTVTAGLIQNNGVYEVATAEQFMQIVLDDKNPLDGSYRLVADIDFKGVDLAEYLREVQRRPFGGTFDGGKYDANNEYTGTNYKILNYVATKAGDVDADGEQAQPGLFYQSYSTTKAVTFKNLDFVDCSVVNATAAGAAIITMGVYDEVAGNKGIVFDNIKMYDCHVEGLKNSALLVGYAKSYPLTIKNCSTDSASSVMTSVHSAAGFVGSIRGNTNRIELTNCANGAAITSPRNVAAIAGNVDGNTNIAITGCSNSGDLSVLGAAKAYLDSTVNTPYAVGIEATQAASDSYKIYCRTSLKTAHYASNTKVEGKFGAADITFAGGGDISIPAVTGATRYMLTVFYSRIGSTYGISFTNTTSADGRVTFAGIKKITAIYDNTPAPGLSGLSDGVMVVTGAFYTLTSDYSGKDVRMQYQVFAFNSAGEIIATATSTATVAAANIHVTMPA